jgi:hypothetical protein
VRPFVLAAAVLAAAAALSGCHSAKSGSGSSLPAVSATESIPTSVPSSLESSAPPTDTAPPVTATPTTATPTSSTASASPSPTAAPAATCSVAALDVRVQRGGAIMQKEYALITFTNNSSTACSLQGYPGVTLQANGTLIGTAGKPSGTSAPAVVLRTGAKATSQITVDTACQAPVSDTVQVTPPGATVHVSRPLTVRACTVTVGPVTAS